MKTGVFSLIFAFTALLTFAQPKAGSKTANFKPGLKSGLVLEYEILSQGQEIPLSMTISTVSDAEIIFDFDFMGGTTGKFVNTKANLEKGSFFNWDQPVAGEERRIAEDQTLAMVSRPFLKDLLTKKKAKYDGMDFIFKPVPKGEEIIIDGKTVDAVFAETESGATRLWVLNDQKYPLILKITGTSAGIDMTIKNIK